MVKNTWIEINSEWMFSGIFEIAAHCCFRILSSCYSFWDIWRWSCSIHIKTNLAVDGVIWPWRCEPKVMKISQNEVTWLSFLSPKKVFLAVMGAEVSLEPSHPGGRLSVKQAGDTKMKIALGPTVVGGGSWIFQVEFIRRCGNLCQISRNNFWYLFSISLLQAHSAKIVFHLKPVSY